MELDRTEMERLEKQMMGLKERPRGNEIPLAGMAERTQRALNECRSMLEYLNDRLFGVNEGYSQDYPVPHQEDFANLIRINMASGELLSEGLRELIRKLGVQ